MLVCNPYSPFEMLSAATSHTPLPSNKYSRIAHFSKAKRAADAKQLVTLYQHRHWTLKTLRQLDQQQEKHKRTSAADVRAHDIKWYCRVQTPTHLRLSQYADDLAKSQLMTAHYQHQSHTLSIQIDHYTRVLAGLRAAITTFRGHFGGNSGALAAAEENAQKLCAAINIPVEDGESDTAKSTSSQVRPSGSGSGDRESVKPRKRGSLVRRKRPSKAVRRRLSAKVTALQPTPHNPTHNGAHAKHKHQVRQFAVTQTPVNTAPRTLRSSSSTGITGHAPSSPVHLDTFAPSTFKPPNHHVEQID